MTTYLRLLMLALAGTLLAARASALCIPLLCTCTVATGNVSFGLYSPMLFGNTDSTGSIKIDCGGVVGLLIPFSIAISAGNSGNFSNRRMRDGSNALNYNLYTDPSYTTIWGDGTSSTQVVNGSVGLDLLGLAPTQTFWIYGRIPGRQLTTAPGNYNDLINLTLTYY